MRQVDGAVVIEPDRPYWYRFAFQLSRFQPGLTAGFAEDSRLTCESGAEPTCLEPGEQKRWSVLRVHLPPAYNGKARRRHKR